MEARLACTGKKHELCAGLRRAWVSLTDCMGGRGTPGNKVRWVGGVGRRLVCGELASGGSYIPA
jgi:hypothetical protein